MNFSKFQTTVNQLIVEQGELLEREIKTGALITTEKKESGDTGDIDIVTLLDKQIEERFYEALSDEFPGLGFHLEERPELNDESKEFVCYIDPIDGTKYFAKGVPLFGISVGVLRGNEEPVFGSIYNPISEQLYSGSEGLPTTLNGVEVTVSDTDEIRKAILSLDVATHKENWEAEKDWINEKIVAFNSSSQRIRLYGAGALSCAWVASGGLDAFVSIWGHGSKPFDIAAGKALIKYAGGEIRDVKVEGLSSPRFVGGNKGLVDQIEDILTQ
ncbi:MAG: inositol monophosphatase family protein [Candidatus Dojkabacteria bacterium]